MKTTLLSILFLFSHSLLAGNAEKCIDQLIGLQLSIKIKSSIADLASSVIKDEDGTELRINSMLNKNVPASELCSKISPENLKMLEDKFAQLKVSKKIALKELETKKKISSVIFAGLDPDAGKDMNEKDICDDVNLRKEQASHLYGGALDCNATKDSINAVSSLDYLSMGVKESCEKFLPKFRDGYEKKEECAKKRLLENRPGKEISADVPTKKIQNNPPPSPNYQRRKTSTPEDIDKIFNPGRRSKAISQ